MNELGAFRGQKEGQCGLRAGHMGDGAICGQRGMQGLAGTHSENAELYLLT